MQNTQHAPKPIVLSVSLCHAKASTKIVGPGPKRASVVGKTTSQIIQAIVTPSTAWAHFYVTSDWPSTAAAGARRISDRTSTFQTRLYVSKITTFRFTCEQARSPHRSRLDLYRTSLSSRREADQRKVCFIISFLIARGFHPLRHESESFCLPQQRLWPTICAACRSVTETLPNVDQEPPQYLPMMEEIDQLGEHSGPTMALLSPPWHSGTQQEPGYACMRRYSSTSQT